MSNILIRCSSVGRLMTEPTAAAAKAGEVLSVGAKTYVRELAAQSILGVDFEISSKQIEKGIECEGDSIDLFNRVFGRALAKNDERRCDEYLSGESDLPDTDEVVDIKTAWSAATFPICPEDIASTQRTLYEWQLRAYMRLWDKPRATLAYCLVNTPERLIGYEPMQLHIVDHIPAWMRVTTWTIQRDRTLEDTMVRKIVAARLYYADVISEFDRTHQPPGIQSPEPPWAEYAVPAANAQCETLEALRRMQADTRARELEAARLEAQRIENLRIAAEQALRQRELDAQAAALRAEQERFAEQRAAEARAAHAQREQDSRSQESGAQTGGDTGNMAHRTDDAAPVGGPAEGVGAAAPAPGHVATAEAAHQDVPPAGAAEKTIPLGAIGERLGFTLTAAFVTGTLGIQPAGRAKAAVLFRESDWPAIKAALLKHIEGLA